MRKSGWHWECVVLAPTGEPIPGAYGTSEGRAVASIFPRVWWPFALLNGYALRWDRVENDTEALEREHVAGKITHGRGALWGAGLV